MVAFSIAVNVAYGALGWDTAAVLQPAGLLRQPPWAIAVMGVVLAPLVETLVFQHWTKRLFDRVAGSRWQLYVLGSGLFFGLSHGVHLSFPPAFLAGIVLALLFWVRDFPGGKPFLHTFAAHALKNGLAFMVTFLG